MSQASRLALPHMSGPFSALMESYFLYSGILVLKLLAFAAYTTIKGNPDRVQKANVNDLKNLTPFWLIGALYMTTGPDEDTAVNLLRAYTISRFIIVVGYIQRMPKCVNEVAFYVSLAVTTYMGAYVVFTYRAAI